MASVRVSVGVSIFWLLLQFVCEALCLVPGPLPLPLFRLIGCN